MILQQLIFWHSFGSGRCTFCYYAPDPPPDPITQAISLVIVGVMCGFMLYMLIRIVRITRT